MRLRVCFAVALALLVSREAGAQFFSQGADPGAVRWYQITTDNYRVIYPEGLDSLARVYAGNLENVRSAVGRGLDMLPNANYARPMPVVLHPYASTGNGMVTWTPRRMELQTTPQYEFPEATPWPMQLAIHESRHVSQMQLGSSKTFRWIKYLLGELVEGALSAIYGGPVFFEGDAVVAETALTEAGRGRSGDFLEYYRACFREGQERDYWQWLYGSLNRYSPDRYALGYMTIAGADRLYDTNFSNRFYERIRTNHGISFLNLQKTMKDVSGKAFPAAFREICGSFRDEWAQDEAARAPFMPSDLLTPVAGRFPIYAGLTELDGLLYAVRSSMDSSPELVSIDREGREKHIARMAPGVDDLISDESDGRIYWAENVPDPRWEMRSFSDIRYMDAQGRIHNLTRGQRYYNPDFHSGMLAVAEYGIDGRSSVVVLDRDGNVMSRTPLPDGMQALEPVWVSGDIYLSILNDEGIGIYRLEGLEPVIAPQKSKLGDLRAEGGKISFVSDLDGVMELYSLDLADSVVEKITSLPVGGHDFYIFDGRLYYTATTPDAVAVYSTPVDSLPRRRVDFSVRYSHGAAEYLNSRETVAVGSGAVEIGAPGKYSKLGHMFRFHSWMPFYFNFDDVSSISFESIYKDAGLGATAFFQNELGSSSGSIAYHARPENGRWRHSGHAKFVYRGWYPVIEANLDFNDSKAAKYSVQTVVGGRKFREVETSLPSLDFGVKTYVPFNFSSGGWSRGFIPQLTFNINNSVFGKYDINGRFLINNYMSRAGISLRGYTMMHVPSSCIYPRWGLGAEAGYVARPLMERVVCSEAYAYLYSYVPGILPAHGIRLSAMGAFKASEGIFTQESVNIAPRGFSSMASSLIGTYPARTRFTLDYALPFADIDWSGMSPVAYLRNFELTAHADCSLYGTKDKVWGNLFSVGADLAARLGNLLWIPYATRIGVSYNYNGGSGFAAVEEACGQGRNSVSLLLSIDF